MFQLLHPFTLWFGGASQNSSAKAKQAEDILQFALRTYIPPMHPSTIDLMAFVEQLLFY